MGKLRVLSGREVADILLENGFSLVRTRGSHEVYQKQSDTGTMTVPVPRHRELKRGTLSSIIRQSGRPRSLFEE